MTIKNKNNTRFFAFILRLRRLIAPNQQLIYI